MAILPWTLVLTIILSRAASLDVGAQISHENNKNIIPNHFIVQLQSPVANSRQEDFEAYAKKAGLDVNIKTTFSDTSIFYGVHLETPSASINRTVAQLNELPLVEKVWPSQMYYQPDYIVKSVLGTSPSDIDISQRLSTLSMTGVDKLHAEGIYGKGVKVGIIDSGIDYTLPELGGGFGPGYLVEFGYDFVGDNYGSTGVAVPDDDPLTTCSNGGHGTHVAGIIAGRKNEWGYQGVAPNVTIGAYRIFSCAGGASDAVIIDALTRAASDGVDTINLSLGISGTWWQDSAMTPVIESLTSQGIVIVVAAGNSGQTGLLTNSIPATVPGAISVGSVDNAAFPYVWNATIEGGESIEFASLDEWAPNSPLTIWTLPNGTEWTGRQPSGCYAELYPSDLPDPETTLVVLQGAGLCSPISKLRAAKAVGMKYVIDLYDNGYDDDFYLPEPYWLVNISYGQPTLPTQKFLLASVGKTVSFFEQDPHPLPQSTGGQMSYFSSEGPSWDLQLSPHVSAPGGNILSSWPGGHAIISGTSMATPFVTGVVALLLSLNPSATPAEIKATIQRTAHPIAESGNSTLTSVSWQGAGLIDAYNAYHFETVISPSEILLNDTANYVQPTITVVNKDTFKKVYQIRYRPALSISKWSNEENPYYWVPVYTQVRTEAYGTVHFGYETITLGPGATRTFSPSFHAPPGAVPSLFPLYSGFITVEEDTTDPRDQYNDAARTVPPESFSIPFLGLAANMKKDISIFKLFEGDGRWMPSLRNKAGVMYLNDTVVTFQNGTYVDFTIWFQAPTQYLEIELVPGDTFFKTTVPTFPDSLRNLPGTDPDPYVKGKPLTSFAPLEAKYLGYLYQWEYFNEQTTLSWSWNGNVYVPNGEDYPLVVTLPNAKYRIFVKALKLYGNPAVVADWETWLSPVITIARP